MASRGVRLETRLDPVGMASSYSVVVGNSYEIVMKKNETPHQ